MLFCARVGSVVDVHKAGGVDGGIGLGGGQGTVAEELLNGAQVASGGQEMRGKAVAHSVRRGG